MEIIKLGILYFSLFTWYQSQRGKPNFFFFPVIVFHSDLLLHRRISFSPPPSLPPATFREALLRPKTTDFEAHKADLHAGGNPADNQHHTRRHARLSSGSLPSTCRRVSARASFSGDGTPHTGPSGAVLVFYPSGGPTRALLIHLLTFLPPPSASVHLQPCSIPPP